MTDSETKESTRCTFFRNKPQYQLWVGLDLLTRYYFIFYYSNLNFIGYCEQIINRTQIINIFFLVLPIRFI